MRHNPAHATTDPEVVRDLVRENPWATIVGSTDTGLVASHYPVLLDEGASELSLLTHVGRPDEEVHDFGDTEVMVVVQGRNGYVSPSWYGPGATRAPTWNFSVAHLYGVPEVLGPEENLATLTRLVERFERLVDEPLYLDQEWGREIAKGTVGLRIPVGRFVCKRKLSQDKDDRSQRQVIAALREPGPYTHPDLADEMEREWEADVASGRSAPTDS
ncbi:MAG TPA: FMN-binding negative transcriptional regulator [Solirubrobacterales bacterium]|nr:FMN-binding negative transcriptional regulator [Solirubrobacterales bacterium]